MTKTLKTALALFVLALAAQGRSAAKNAGGSGAVVVNVVVDETGKVVVAEPFCGHPMLVKEAVEAARKARFTPMTLSGVPFKVSGVITYNFTLL
jgi:TonB family protein